jgi:hypothetical protein
MYMCKEHKNAAAIKSKFDAVLVANGDFNARPVGSFSTAGGI